MTLTSFVILFHPSRLDNLLQTIRFLHKREPELLKEIIVICQTKCDNIPNTKTFNMGLSTYHKPKMTNFGVSHCSGEIIALLDSDRILPKNYFTEIVNEIKFNDVISTINLFQLDKIYSDEEIENGLVSKTPDFRSKENKGRKKNLFSGNTIITKDSYLSLGGYDESFEGYGFADTDMTQTVQKTGNIIWKEKEELHLYHKKNIIYKNEALNCFNICTAINAIKYFNKWKTNIDDHTLELIEFVYKNLNIYPKCLQKEFKKLTRTFNMI